MGGATASQAGDGTCTPNTAEAQALRALRLDWGAAWDIGRGDIRWQAARRDGTGHVLTRASADGLALALRISYGRPS
jgi:hypothetical protein